MTNEENPLDYFKNLKCDSPHPELSLQDMEIIIKSHEKELAEEDKRVAGTDEYPNYGDDFADMVYIARRLFDENVALSANQCHAGYGGEYGHHRCKEIDRLTEQRDEARREVCDMVARTRRKTGIRGQIVGLDRVTPTEIAVERGWDCFAQEGGGA